MRFKHSGGRGDVVYALPAIRELGGGILCLNANVDFHVSCPLLERDMSLFAELLSGHPYIESVEHWHEEPVEVNLDDFRLHLARDRHLAQSHLLATDSQSDLTQPWLDSSLFEPCAVADVVVNRTCRFHGFLSRMEMERWKDRVVFVGMVEEHEKFVADTGLKIRYESTSTFKRLAEVILGSRLFIGNQSFPFALAEAFKHPRVLEVFPNAPNCMPSGADAHTRLTSALLESVLAQ